MVRCATGIAYHVSGGAGANWRRANITRLNGPAQGGVYPQTLIFLVFAANNAMGAQVRAYPPPLLDAPMPLLSLSLLTALFACSGGPQDGPESEVSSGPISDPRPLVQVEVLGRGAVTDLLISNGVVESEAQADLVPEATGTVVAIKAEEGDKVRKGQVLAILENVSLDAGLARAEAELARAQAELERVTGLHAKGAVSDRELQEAKYAERSAVVALKEARGTQGHTRIVSPIDGTVSIRELQYGEVAGGQRAFQVVDLSSLRVVIKLPERDLVRLKVGQEASLVSLYDEETRVPGHVTRISPTVDAQTGTVRVTVALDDPDMVLRPGQFVSVRVEVDRHDDVLVLPRRAVFYEEGDATVFVVATEPAVCEQKKLEAEEDKEKKPKKKGWGKGKEEAAPPEVEVPGPCRIARKASVTLGFEGEDSVEMIEGPAETTQVIVVGQTGLRDETRVRLAEDPKVQAKAETKAAAEPKGDPEVEADAGSAEDEKEG